MDEPTNHLDLPSIECLEDALAECPCGLLLVSHDPYYLDRLTTIRWQVRAGTKRGGVCSYPSQRQEERHQDIPHDEDRMRPLASCWRGVGGVAPRSLLWGAKQPPYLTGCTRSGGPSAASSETEPAFNQP